MLSFEVDILILGDAEWNMHTGMVLCAQIGFKAVEYCFVFSFLRICMIIFD